MKGKVFKLFAVLIMICITVNVIQPEETEAYDYKDEYQIYLADYLSENTVAKSYLDHDINMPYRKYVEDRVNDPAWNALLGSWELATFNLSDVSEISFKLVGYYETILFDIIKTNRESDSELENIEKLVKGTHAGAFKKVYELYGDILSKDLKTLQENSAEYNKIMSTVNGLKEFENAFEMIGNVEDFVGYCTTLNDILYKCSVIETVVANNEYYSKIFLDMSKKANSEAMRMACENFSIICSQSISSEEIKMAFAGEAAAKEISKKVLSKVWSNVVEQCTGYGLAISVGQSMGKLSANLLFSTDENIEHYFSCRALYNFENQLSELTSDYKKTYNSLHSLESAKIYNTAFNLLLKTHLEGADYSKKIAELQYDKGAINQLFKYFNQEDYDGYMKTVGMIEDMIEDYIEFINVESYNDFVEYMAAVDDGNCFKNAAADISPEPVTVTASDYNKAVLQVQSVSDSYYGKTVDDDWTLTADFETHGNVTVTSGMIDLDGHTLTIHGDLIQTGGTIYINNGTLNIDGDCKIESEKTNNVGEIEYSKVYADFSMVNKYDKVNVKGDFIWHGDDNYFNDGVLTIGGDFVDRSSDSFYCFSASENHKVVLDGDKNQNVICCEEYKYCPPYEYRTHFNQLEVVNPESRKIVWSNIMSVNKLLSDINIVPENILLGELDINGKTVTIEGNATINSNVDINGGTLNINGDCRQIGGTVSVNNGTLNIDGDFKIEAEEINNVGETEYYKAYADFSMVNKNDKVNIKGDFIWHGDDDYFNDGVLTIGGDFIDRSSDSCYFSARENNKVVLNGNKNQNVICCGDYNTHFNQLEVVNPESRKIVWSNIMSVNKLLSDINIVPENILLGELDINGKTVTIEGNATINSNVDINGGTLNINGDCRQIGGTVSVNNGTLNIDGDFKIEAEEINNVGETEYYHVYANFSMINKNDKVNIKGDFIWHGYHNNLSNGILTIGGDFIDRTSDGYCFYANENHKVVLNGSNHQNITFENGGTFNILELTKDKSNYTFNPEPCWNKLITVPAVTTTTTSVTTTVSTTVTKVTTTSQKNTTTSQKNTTTSETSNTSVTTVTKPATSATTSVTTTMMSTKVSATSTTKKSTKVSATSTTKKSTTTPVTSTGNSVTTTVKTEPKLLGDANNDGKVTIADIVLMQKYLTNADVDIHYEAIDMNEDGKFNVFDLIVIKRMILNAK